MTRDSFVNWVRLSTRTVESAGYSIGMLTAFGIHEHLVPTNERKPLLDRYRQAWLIRMLRLFNVDITVAPGEPTRASGPRLVVANHRSIVDIAVLLRLYGGYIVSRADVAGWPVIGSLARTSGTIFVDRAASQSRSAALQSIHRCLSEGSTVVIFPEGSTFEGDEVRPFRSGAFAAARDTNAEIVTVGLAYPRGAEFGDETFFSHLGRVAAEPTTRVAVCIGTAIRASQDARATADECRLTVQSLVRQAREKLEARSTQQSSL